MNRRMENLEFKNRNDNPIPIETGSKGIFINNYLFIELFNFTHTILPESLNISDEDLAFFNQTVIEIILDY